MQHYAPATEQRPASPVASVTSYTYYRREPRELPLPNEHCSSIATFSQKQQPITTDMVTQTTTAIAATTTVRPNTPPIATTTTTPSQQIAEHLQTALWRTPGGSGGSGSTGNPTGPEGPGGAGGPGGLGGPAPAAAAPVVPAAAAPANHDDRLMGSLPQPYEGDQKLARTFLDQLVHYFRANAQVPELNSAIRKVSIALTLFQGQQTAAC
jgi:hypothetical protein